jgi:hypothetical protein
VGDLFPKSMPDRSASSPAATLAIQVCTAASAVLCAAPNTAFLLRRAEVDAEDAGPEVGRALGHVLRTLRESDREDPRWKEALASALSRAGGVLERRGEPGSARLLFELACELRPGCAATALHVARAARLAGDTEVARAFYARAGAQDPQGRIARLARIGEAMISRAGERRISAEIREAVRSGDAEAAGVGLEARASLRCEDARCREAIRDLCACALRYPDREDQARAAQRVAALLIASNDLAAAREALLLAHRIGTPAQRAESRASLYALSEELGDALGMRRWGGAVAETNQRGRGGAGEDLASASRSRTGGNPASASRGRATADLGSASRSVPSEEPNPVGRIRAVPAPNPDSAGRRRTLPVIRDWRDAVERKAGAS